MNNVLREEAGLAYHERRAQHFRRLADTATTPSIKERLLTQAEEHERLARGETEAAAIEPETTETP
jgi:hypothetical protein